MRNYSYRNKWQKLLTPGIVRLLTQIHEYKGEQSAFTEAKADALSQLAETAKIQSIAASDMIEGIYIPDDRLKSLAMSKTIPRTRNEQEMAGYRDVLSMIHESHDFLPVKPLSILQLHRDLYKFSGKSMGGSYKELDDAIAEEERKENSFAGFPSVPAGETPAAVDAICTAFAELAEEPDADPLLIIPMFLLDFLCICPFRDGNGRMSRLLMHLLFDRAGYTVGKYVSMEKMIAQSRESYCEALRASSVHWQEGQNDYIPFVQYTLGIVSAAYRAFSFEMKLIAASNVPKPERIRRIIKDTSGKITKTEIMKKCPDISQVTVQRALNDLLKGGEIRKISGGRYTSYVWNDGKNAYVGEEV